MMRWDLQRGFPLFTTKTMAWRWVVEELLWFISGCTDSNVLSQRGVKIWDANGSAEFLASRGLTENRAGDLGPIYGWQWRHFGASYRGCDADYTGEGVDQLAHVIETIKNNPSSRRIIMSAWNPADLDKMALPPCHMSCQFFVSQPQRGEGSEEERAQLSCMMVQRSADLGLGVPFNVASYSLLTHMIAHVCDLDVGEFVHVMGDTHVYVNHTDPLSDQLERIPFPFPALRIRRKVESIDDFRFEDFELLNYKHHGRVVMEMAV